MDRLSHIPLLTEDLPASTRDGHLRQAISEALDLAENYGCRLIALENLGFDEMRATDRERYGSAKKFRKMLRGMPTGQFRDRLVAMASRRRIAVVGVPAAYSSIWGAKYWQGPLSSKSHKVSKHSAAALVLGRRALGHRARTGDWACRSSGKTQNGECDNRRLSGWRRPFASAGCHLMALNEERWTDAVNAQGTSRGGRG